MNDGELDAAIRDHLHQVTAAAPPPHPSPHTAGRRAPEPRSRWRRPLLPAAAAALAAGALWAGLGGNGGGHVVAGPDDPAARGTTKVTRELVGIQVTWDLDCDTVDHGLGDPPVDIQVETWWSEERKVLRQQWRYPDGTTREMVVAGDPWAPSEVHEVGRTGGPATFGCKLGSANVGEPGDGELFMLNPVPSPAAATLLDERVTYGAEVVPGQWQDQLGRRAERHLTYGEGAVDGPDGTRVDATETMEWFLDPDAGHVLERRFSVAYDPTGTLSWSAVLLDSSDEEVPLEVFQPDRLGEPVTLDRSGPTATTAVDPRQQPTTTVQGSALPGTATMTPVGGDDCDIEVLPDLSGLLPEGFTGPHQGIGGWDPPAPESWCSRFWQGPEPWVHLTQRPGGVAYEPLPKVHSGQYRWGEIEEGFAFEHAGAPQWSLVVYGLDPREFSGLMDAIASALPDGR